MQTYVCVSKLRKVGRSTRLQARQLEQPAVSLVMRGISKGGTGVCSACRGRWWKWKQQCCLAVLIICNNQSFHTAARILLGLPILRGFQELEYVSQHTIHSNPSIKRKSSCPTKSSNCILSAARLTCFNLHHIDRM